MNGARFVHDQLELAGWEVPIADGQTVKGLAPLACKADRIDAWVLAELARRDLVPAIWLPTPAVRAERERARWRLHLVRHRVALKNRVHAASPRAAVCDLGPVRGGRSSAAGPAEVARTLGQAPRPQRSRSSTTSTPRSTAASGHFVGWAPTTPVPLLMTAPGIAWVLGYTIAAELGDIGRLASPKRLVGYTGLCPGVYQSGGRDHRRPVARNGSLLRWALVEAAIHAARHPVYRDHYQHTRQR